MTSVEQHRVNSNKKLAPTNYKPPRKPSFNPAILTNEDFKQVLLQHQRQPTLQRPNAEKFRNSYKKQICMEMLTKGFHKSFSELQELLCLQINDRTKLGSDHPIWDKPLLDQEPKKLDYLCTRLNKAEEAERAGLFKVVYSCYHDLANYFLSTDDSWLSDYFFKKCLVCVTSTQQAVFDAQKAAESHCNIGLAFERQNAFFEAMKHFEEYYNLSKNQEWIKRENEFPYEHQSTEYTANKDNLVYERDNRLFTDACINLQRIYKLIANRYTRNINQKIKYLNKAYEACKDCGIKTLEGQVSQMLAEAYKTNGDMDTALKFYENFYNIAKAQRDVNFGKASEDLAMCYQKLGNISKSIEYLKNYLTDFSAKEDDKQYARVCSCLANIYNSLGKYEIAYNYSSKAFEISNRINQQDAIEFNRVLCGISKGHQILKSFNNAIEKNSKESVNSLLLWKCDLDMKLSLDSQ